MTTEDKKPVRFKVPDTYVIIFLVVVLAAVLTHIIPAGQFKTHEITYQDAAGSEKTHMALIPESFTIVGDANGQAARQGIKLFEPGGGVGLFNYMFEGLASGSKWGSAVGVIAFILVIGGAFGIILKTGAVEAGILLMITKAKGAEVMIIPLMFFLFSLGGAVFGMGEEAIAFAMILVPLVIAMGYDSIVGVLITYVATQIGFATSWMNPFSVAIAQGIAGVPVLSGAGFRIFMWTFFTSLGVVYTWWYAGRIRKNPASSCAYQSDAYFRDDFKQAKEMDIRFRLGHGLVLLTILLGIIWIIWGVVAHAYYIPELATQFFIMGIVAGIIGVLFKLNDMTVNDMAASFRSGAKDLLDAALVVGMAKGIVLVLGGDNPGSPTVLNTILHSTGEMIGGAPPFMCAWFMFLFQSGLNFFVVSGSGQAALTMPLMGPLADLVGVTRQVAVVAFQLGDGFTNIIVPTSGALVGVLGVARLDWAIWARFVAKLVGMLFLLGSLFVIGVALVGFN